MTAPSATAVPSRYGFAATSLFPASFEAHATSSTMFWNVVNVFPWFGVERHYPGRDAASRRDERGGSGTIRPGSGGLCGTGAVRPAELASLVKVAQLGVVEVDNVTPMRRKDS